MNNEAKQTAAENFRDSFGETEEPWLDREDRRYVDEADVAVEPEPTVAEVDRMEDNFYAMYGYHRG